MHDFRVFKESKTHINSKSSVVADSGYQGLQKILQIQCYPKYLYK